MIIMIMRSTDETKHISQHGNQTTVGQMGIATLERAPMVGTGDHHHHHHHHHHYDLNCHPQPGPHAVPAQSRTTSENPSSLSFAASVRGDLDICDEKNVFFFI